jgi:hypothetical protein
MVCNDFTNFINTGEEWVLKILTITADDMKFTKFGPLFPDNLKRYKMACWLADRMTKESQSHGAIQYSIWKLFVPSTPDPFKLNNYWHSLASANIARYDFTNFRVLTPEGKTGLEFITTLPELLDMMLNGPGIPGVSKYLWKSNVDSNVLTLDPINGYCH